MFESPFSADSWPKLNFTTWCAYGGNGTFKKIEKQQWIYGNTNIQSLKCWYLLWPQSQITKRFLHFSIRGLVQKQHSSLGAFQWSGHPAKGKEYKSWS